MKNTFEPSTRELGRDEMMNIYGGSEFTESIARGVGWIVGGVVSIWETTVRYQMEMEKNGIHPRI